MSPSSSLSEVIEPLVLDASVLINLHACGLGDRILEAIPNDVFIVDIVARELEHETSRRNGEFQFINKLKAHQLATFVGMEESELEMFWRLTTNSPSLDDGEAATIAVAATRRLCPVIDEKKGRKVANKLIAPQKARWSLDLFRHPAAVEMLGDSLAIEALYLALRDGRMRIPAERTDDVIALVGTQRSRECTCLPGYRLRFRNDPDAEGRDKNAHDDRII